MQVPYAAPQYVRDSLARLGKTEAIRFSSSNKLLAIAAYSKNAIPICNVSIDQNGDEPNIIITGLVEICSDWLRGPHGIDFIDDEQLIVANRWGDVVIFDVPTPKPGAIQKKLTPRAIIKANNDNLVRTPGSVAISGKDKDLYEVLICNNFSHTVTRHFLDLSKIDSAGGKILVKKGLEVPDGICISSDKRWIAVSNHDRHNVFIYENTSTLNEFSNPDGILRCVLYPHGMRFTSDNRFVLVADAGAPYVHVYFRNQLSWRGVHAPLLSVRVLTDEDYLRGRIDPQEGGPKGLDIGNYMNTMVTTCENHPLCFLT